MPSLREYLRHGGQMLARRLDQLCANLENLNDRLRRTIANAIGETLGGITHDVALRVLDDLTQFFPGPAPIPTPWDLGDRIVRMQKEGYHPDQPGYWQDAEEPAAPEPEPKDLAAQAPGRLPAAVSAGLQAAAWCLKRWSGKGRALSTLAAGLFATTIAYIGGPLAAAVLSLAGSATQFAAASESLAQNNHVFDYFDP